MDAITGNPAAGLHQAASESWVLFRTSPGTVRSVAPRARWARDHRYKLYDDGRLVDCVNDPDELEALDPGVEPEGVRTRLQAALDAMPPEPEHLRGK